MSDNKKDDKDERQDYIISRISDAISAFEAGDDILDKLSQLNAANQAEVEKAELLFGSRDSFLREIDQIIADSHLLLTCDSCKESIEHVASEIVEFIDKARNYLDSRNPFRKEKEALIRAQNCTDEEFDENWTWLSRSLSATYRTDQLYVDFYSNDLSATSPGSSAYALARHELLAEWERQLTIKEIDYELHMLSALRRKFYNAFREKLADFRAVIQDPYLDAAHIGLFWGLSKGTWRPNAFQLMNKYAMLLHQNKSIRHLLSELGRDGFRDGDESVNAKKTVGESRFSRSQKSDIYGITESDDLCALLPLEVAMLSDSNLENDFYKRFTEKKLRTFSYCSQVTKYVDAIENQIKLQEEKCGPFIVCIDTSGSMCGTPEELAKTICYGLIVKSQEQHRNCFVISFSTTVEVLDISDLANNSKAIMDFLMHSFNGGTDLAPALSTAIDMLTDERYRKADVLFISDFMADNFGSRIIAAMNSAKQHKTRFHSLRIGDFNNDELLRHFNMQWEYRSGQIILQKDMTNN